MCETKCEDLELSKCRSDEVCMGVVSNKNPRDDGFTLLFLHIKDRFCHKTYSKQQKLRKGKCD